MAKCKAVAFPTAMLALTSRASWPKMEIRTKSVMMISNPNKAFVGGVVLTLATAVYCCTAKNIGLRAELAEVRAQQAASYKKTIEQK